MKRPKKYLIAVSLICFCQPLYGWENRFTHPAITKQVVTSSAASVDDYLKTQLGLSGGINTQLSYSFLSETQKRITRASWDSGKTQRTLLEWLKVGGCYSI